MGFTENFNYCMEQRGYSAYKFAKIIDVNIQSPVNWKAGSVIPHKKTRQKIADHFGITLAELDGDELPVLPPEGAKKAPTGAGEREFVPSYEDWEKQAESWTLDQLDNAIWKLFQIKRKREGKHGE